MYVAQFTRKFSAAHRVAGDPGVCRRIHGHNYLAEITVTSDRLDATQFVIPADLVKEVVDERFDHKLILDFDDALGPQMLQSWTLIDRTWIAYVVGPPSTENLSREIAESVVANLIEHHADENMTGSCTVQLTETPTIQAQFTAYVPKVKAGNIADFQSAFLGSGR